MKKKEFPEAIGLGTLTRLRYVYVFDEMTIMEKWNGYNKTSPYDYDDGGGDCDDDVDVDDGDGDDDNHQVEEVSQATAIIRSALKI